MHFVSLGGSSVKSYGEMGSVRASHNNFYAPIMNIGVKCVNAAS